MIHTARVVLAATAAAAAALLLAASADAVTDEDKLDSIVNFHLRSLHETKTELPKSCLYDGRWHKEGSTVLTRESCLRCVCLRGTLTCRRRACAPLPDPLPPRCHVRHKRGSCCPDLHCPPGQSIPLEHGASAKFESPDYLDSQPAVATPSTVSNACVEGGTVYAAGSAMGSRVACELCFCLAGARRCVSPTCLPPPDHCAPRPAPGACCPDRYYCDRSTTDSVNINSVHDCKVDGKVILEGERVLTGDNCTTCFCLHGEVHCQALGCAPPLSGCRPLLALGDCCAHQYICDHTKDYLNILPARGNTLVATRHDYRAFHSLTTKTTTPKTLNSIFTSRQTPITAPTKNFITTTKVKRKTDDQPVNFYSYKTNHNFSDSDIASTKTTSAEELREKLVPEKEENDDEEEDEDDSGNDNKNDDNKKKVSEDNNQDDDDDEEEEQEQAQEESADSNNKDTDDGNDEISTDETTDVTTEQPEGTVKIMINGTINCTAELSSTSLPLSITHNDTEKIQMEAMPRVPIVNIEAQTYSPNDIITDRNVNGGFDENDTFTINVTSSLMANTSRSTSKPIMFDAQVQVPQDLVAALNTSKKTKGDYDYDYDMEPTLPPSLPNLKIIPFVAADAVVDDPVKETFPILDREQKYPVYYPSAETTKDSIYATRREDVLSEHQSQYPIFISDKDKVTYHNAHEVPVDITSSRYPLQNNVEIGLHEFTVSTSLGHNPDVVSVTKEPTTSTTFKLETPAVNLFSPPVETEGGFVPKGPGIVDDYYPVVASTAPSPVVPHLTTSMQLDITKGECTATDGRVVGQGQSITVGCMECTCTWQRMRCAPRICLTLPGCRRKPTPPPTAEPCCRDVICGPEIETTTAHVNRTANHKNKTDDVTTKMTTLSSTTSSINNITITEKPKTNEMTTKGVTSANTYTTVVTVPPKTNMNSVQNLTSSTSTSTTTLITKLTSTTSTSTSTTTPPPINLPNDTSQEYDDDDDGFSFGSVLKLLLSDSYESTTTAPYRKPPTKPPMNPTYPSSTTTRKPPPTMAPFIPLPLHPYIPPKIVPNTVNRIDHLVLGEATAIKRTTPKPITNKTTKLAVPKTTTEATTTPVVHEGPRPPNLGGIPGAGSGLLKLAGCNIYGRMYRVGRIIAELSTPCQECWCTEIGVQCNQLRC